MVKQGNSHTTHATKENRNFWKKGPIKHTYVHKIMSLHSTKEKLKFLGQCLKNECILVSSELFFMMKIYNYMCFYLLLIYALYILQMKIAILRPGVQ